MHSTRAGRTWLAVTIAAVGCLAAGCGSDQAVSTPPVDRVAGTSPQAAPGWRWESYGGVQVSVPVGWNHYGTADSAWCVGDRGQAAGEIGRPGPILMIKCPDRIPLGKLGEHLWLSSSTERAARRSEQLGDGWVRDLVIVGNVSIEVQTHGHPGVRRHILDSVREVGTDANGCSVTHAVSEPGLVRPQDGLDWATPVTGLSACRYEIQLDKRPVPGLVASVRYDAGAAAAILAAIRRAPAGAGPDDPGSTTPEFRYGMEATVLRFDTADGVREIFVRYGGSELNGFDNGAGRRQLTIESVAFMTGPLTQFSGTAPTAQLFPRPR
jgi:hypothetical protein